jgi:hypothetical protein
MYAYSDDHGRTWRNNDGAVIGTAGSSPIVAGSAGVVAWPIEQNRGLINQESLAVDSSGRVHVLLSHMPDAEGSNSNFAAARSASEFFHYWRDTDGTWSREALGLDVIENYRGSLAISSSNNVYAVLPDLRIAGASAGARYSDWTLLHSDSGRFFSDPLIDTARLETENNLTIYYPQRDSEVIWGLDFTIE